MHTMTPGQRSLGSLGPVEAGQCWWQRPGPVQRGFYQESGLAQLLLWRGCEPACSHALAGVAAANEHLAHARVQLEPALPGLVE